MAKIIGGIAASHTPTIGFAFDRDKQNDPVWAPIFEGFEPVQDWIERAKPDVLLFIYNDHVTSFFFDHYSPFALGVGSSWSVADEGGGPRDLPAIEGHPSFAAHLGRSLISDEFDMSFFQGRPLDHGCFSPLSVMCPHQPEWPVKLVPLQMGVLQHPVPSARRFYKLGQALRRAIESYPEDLRVVVVATGGLSHQVHGERAGFNNPEWDARFLELFERDPERLAQLSASEYATLGGFEGAEVVMWLTMRGALSANVKSAHRSYYLPSMTGIATAIYETTDQAADAKFSQRHRENIAHELGGVERLTGTYPFTLERSVKAFHLNRFLHSLVEPARREAFLLDEVGSLCEAGLTDEERQLVLTRSWLGLIQYGVIFFLLEKLGAVIGISNLHIYAAMRGETLEEFQKTRNTNALYSVAGNQFNVPDWAKTSS